MMAVSLMGVSITRSQPNRSKRPAVTLKAPPYTPMSSPMQTTAGSRAISSKSAWRIPSSRVTSATAIFSLDRVRLEFAAPRLAPLRLHRRARRSDLRHRALPLRLDEQRAFAINRAFGELGRRKRRILGKREILLHHGPDAFQNLRLLLVRQHASRGQTLLVRLDGVPPLPILEHFLGHIFGRIVLRVAAHAHRLRLDNHR